MVRTMLEGANQYEVLLTDVFNLRFQNYCPIQRFHPAAEHYFKDVTPPSADDLEPGKLLLERGRQWTSMEGNSAPGAPKGQAKNDTP